MSRRKPLAAALAALGVGILVLIAVVLVRTGRYGAGVAPFAEAAVRQARTANEPVDSAAIGRLSAAVRIPTVTVFDSAARLPEFAKLRALFEKSYPLVHARLSREVIDSGTLLYIWRGTDTTLAPVLLMGHQDVVPVEPGTEKNWKHGAFSGDVADGYIWGRGTLDDKVAVLGLLEAAESLLRRRVLPQRTVLFVFGHTEERGGAAAQHAAELLRSRGVKPWFVLDEGGAVGDGMVPGVSQRVALVGVAEKGYLSLRLTAHGASGHSSTPPRETAISILGRAVDRVQRSPLPARLQGATLAMFDAVGPLMPYSRRLALANLWLFGPLVTRMAAKQPAPNAMVRTTTAVTMISGGVKDNVVPATASAVVNFRLLPGDSVAWVIAAVKRAIDDPRVSVEPVSGSAREASEESPTSTVGYQVLTRTIGQIFPGTRVAPYLLMGGTDSRNFYIVTPNVYRFLPVVANTETLTLIHGTNERLRVDDYLEAIRFYRALIENAAL